MHKATDIVGSLIKELKLSYNKARQAAITGEILKLVGGAEALKDKVAERDLRRLSSPIDFPDGRAYLCKKLEGNACNIHVLRDHRNDVLL